LNVIRIHIPALRERKEDVPLLMGFFLKRAAQELSAEAKVFDKQVEAWLKQQPWPGNVRQLENLSRWLTVMASSREIRLSDLPAELITQSQPDTTEPAGSWESALQLWAEQQLDQGIRQILDTATPTFERILISVALSKTGGRKQDAARLLGWGRNTLTRKLKELNMQAED
jgi:two-component system, NtrC family, nitrogen regulation response regulator GlnG